MYITKHKYVHTQQEYFDSIIEFSVEAGWVIHDNISSTNKVLSSSGENNDTSSVMYVNIYISSNIFYIVFYGYWDNVNHVGYSSLNILSNGSVVSKTFSSENSLFNRSEMYFVGNKNYIFFGFILYNNGSLYFSSHGGWGTFSTTLNKIKHSSVSSVSIGSDVSVTLDSVEGLYINNYYQIFDKTFKVGCELVKIKSINQGTKTIILENVTVNFPDGVYFGLNICPFFIMNTSRGYLRSMYPTTKTGTELLTVNFNSLSLFSNENNSFVAPIVAGSLNEFQNNILNRNIFYDNNSGLPVGYFDNNIRSCKYTNNQTILKSTLCYNNDNSDVYNSRSYFTNTADDFSYVEDIRKNWTVDSLIGKYIVIITGRGTGQSRQIVSNTNNRINLLNNFLLNVDCTSQYVIVDVVYRMLTESSNSPYPCIWYRDIF